MRLYKRADGTLRVVIKGKYRAQAHMFSASQSNRSLAIKSAGNGPSIREVYNDGI